MSRNNHTFGFNFGWVPTLLKIIMNISCNNIYIFYILIFFYVYLCYYSRNLQTSNLKYLTVRQALEDLATFIVNKTNATGSNKVCTIQLIENVYDYIPFNLIAS